MVRFRGMVVNTLNKGDGNDDDDDDDDKLHSLLCFVPLERVNKSGAS
jgi:hypothetical protein